MHPVLKESIKRLRTLNPRWQHRLYDDADIRGFISQNFSAETLRYYKRINPVYGPAKADFFRYLLMYKVGGVYLDVKSSLSRPLDEAITGDEYLLSHWSNNKLGQRYEGYGLHPGLGPDGELQQWHIVAPPGHPYLEAVIARVMRNIDEYDPFMHGTGKLGVLRVTGPIAYTNAIEPIRQDHPHRMVDIEQLGFIYSVTGGSAHDPRHELLFPNHYRGSLEPIVRDAAGDDKVTDQVQSP
jgi:mannosyltransferase OCH1-like enzyme